MLSKIYEWHQDKTDEVIYGDDVKHRDLKSFGLGMIDGALTFMTVFGTVVYAAFIVKNIKSAK